MLLARSWHLSSAHLLLVFSHPAVASAHSARLVRILVVGLAHQDGPLQLTPPSPSPSPCSPPADIAIAPGSPAIFELAVREALDVVRASIRQSLSHSLLSSSSSSSFSNTSSLTICRMTANVLVNIGQSKRETCSR